MIQDLVTHRLYRCINHRLGIDSQDVIPPIEVQPLLCWMENYIQKLEKQGLTDKEGNYLHPHPIKIKVSSQSISLILMSSLEHYS